jgi:hypothetical protein
VTAHAGQGAPQKLDFARLDWVMPQKWVSAWLDWVSLKVVYSMSGLRQALKLVSACLDMVMPEMLVSALVDYVCMVPKAFSIAGLGEV